MKGANWTKRLFQLEASKLQLQYFEDTDTSVFKIIQLSPGDTCSDETRVSDKPEYQFFFKIHHKSGESSELAALSEVDRDRWMSEIRSICVSSFILSFMFIFCEAYFILLSHHHLFSCFFRRNLLPR